MVSLAYFDTLSIQQEIEMYKNCFSNALDNVSSIEVKKQFYQYYMRRTTDERLFIKELLRIYNDNAASKLNEVILGFENDLSSNANLKSFVTSPLQKYTLGRLSDATNEKPYMQANNMAAGLVEYINDKLKQQNNDDGWKAL